MHFYLPRMDNLTKGRQNMKRTPINLNIPETEAEALAELLRDPLAAEISTTRFPTTCAALACALLTCGCSGAPRRDADTYGIEVVVRTRDGRDRR